MQDQWLSVDSLLSPSAINRYMRCPLQLYYRYIADIKEPDQPDDEQELDNRIFGNIFHNAADTLYHQLPQYVTKEVLEQLLKNKATIERAVDDATCANSSRLTKPSPPSPFSAWNVTCNVSSTFRHQTPHPSPLTPHL